MAAVRVHGRGLVRTDAVPVPAPGPNDVLVRVAACGLCGSDITYIAAGGVAFEAEEPFGLGHELSGTVLAVGDQGRDIQPGMRVVVNPMGDGNAIGNGAPDGGFAPYLLIPNATLGSSILPIPDSMSFERAALAEPLSVALHAVRRSGATTASKVAIFGAGPIGLGILMFLKRQGVTDIAVVDRSPSRLERARALGAAHLVDASGGDPAAALGDAHGRGELFGWPTVGTDLYFEASGAAPVLPAIVGMAPFHARVVVVAVHKEPVAINWQMALGKEMTFTTSMAYPDEFPAVLSALADPAFETEPFVSHRFSLDRFDEALTTARDPMQSAKVLIDCTA